jgi:excisionase family DNA binding protein
MTDKEITAHEAAAQLGYHVNHLYRLLRSGTVKGRKVADRVWLVPQDEVDRVKALQDKHGRLPRSNGP